MQGPAYIQHMPSLLLGMQWLWTKGGKHNLLSSVEPSIDFGYEHQVRPKYYPVLVKDTQVSVN